MPTESELDVVTGAFGYSGASITRVLLERGRRVRTITGHPDRPDPFRGSLEVVPYRFDDPDELSRSLAGTRTLYNTYWVRFEHGGTTFDQAVRNSNALVRAAEEAGVRRIVHLSVTKPDEGAKRGLPYFVGKAEVERAIVESELSYAIVRPTVIYGAGDILINNIAWLLRRFPVFAIPGNGSYRVRPVHVDDLAQLSVEAGEADDRRIIDAAGPDTYTFEEMVRLIAAAVRSRSRLIHVPTGVALSLSRMISPLVRDRIITRDELRGMMEELVVTEGEPTGKTRFVDWLADAGPSVGKHYASELDRHYR